MMRYTFPVSGVTTWVVLPFAVAFFLAFFGAMAGVTGAFLLLPFQLSVLGYTAAGVSATNFVYNVFAIPGTVTRYGQEGRINWPLALAITGGSLPGITVGYFLRITYLTDLRYFKPFAGLVLLYLAWLVGRSVFGKARKDDGPAPERTARISGMKYGFTRMSFSFAGCDYDFDPRPIFLVSLIVGVVGGAYGIGGGAVLAPFCIAVMRLPVHSVAGASLLGTLVCSVVGVAVYSFGIPEARPDFLLGALFGVGGMVGGYLGARCQKHIPQRPIKIGIFIMLLFASFRYLLPLLKN
ncbi:MAG: sulfite exporter TauE/SafE family protein [Proteobacteria bacterium]|nr:sulfite exporter TauE/SafE family protein [Pseudomonadota bacterium]MBU1738073.1 sulfite exporter TauE/SafE family protein [Pseudomonadota bacterium]